MNAFAGRIVLPYEPSAVVVYAGDNDIARGKSPQRVVSDYQKFARLVKQRLPESKIVFIAIKHTSHLYSHVPDSMCGNCIASQGSMANHVK